MCISQAYNSQLSSHPNHYNQPRYAMAEWYDTQLTVDRRNIPSLLVTGSSPDAAGLQPEGEVGGELRRTFCGSG